jgi:HAD superfamily hydrolase (TIGR01548 family)
MKATEAKPDAKCKPDREPAVLFDMDGVLVDVSKSYRIAIQETVRFFSGQPAQPEEIQALKERGGYNNDWDLTEAILKSRGKTVPKADIVEKFQELYLGVDGKGGLIENETWQLPKPQLEALHARHCLGIVTGRPRGETLYPLQKLGLERLFDVMVVMEDYPPEKAKPNPYPITLAVERLGVLEAVYVGDSVDDVAAAKGAGIRAFGCIPPGVSTEPLKQLLLKSGAEKVLANVQEINSALE